MISIYDKICNLQMTNFFFTLIIVAILLVLRAIALRYVARKTWGSETIHLRAHSYVKATFSITLAFLIIFIWIPQIQAFAFSVAAIAVAIAVSLKEFIMMLTGGLARTSLDFINIGERIEVNGIKGDVMKTGFLSTTFAEVGNCQQRTGRIMSVPNNIFFSYPVLKDQTFGDFSVHTITIPIKPGTFSSKALNSLQEYLKKETAPYQAAFIKKFKALSKKDAFLGFDVDPRVLLSPRKTEEYDIIIRLPVLIQEKVKFEQKVISKTLELFAEKKQDS